MNNILCIGGPLDGKVQEVEGEETQLKVNIPKYDLATKDPLTMPMATLHEAGYTRVRLTFGTSVFLYNPLIDQYPSPIIAILDYLLRNYRPLVPKGELW